MTEKQSSIRRSLLQDSLDTVWGSPPSTSAAQKLDSLESFGILLERFGQSIVVVHFATEAVTDAYVAVDAVDSRTSSGKRSRIHSLRGPRWTELAVVVGDVEREARANCLTSHPGCIVIDALFGVEEVNWFVRLTLPSHFAAMEFRSRKSRPKVVRMFNFKLQWPNRGSNFSSKGASLKESDYLTKWECR